MSSSETGPEKGVVIVGGGLAAARTAEQLRKSEYAGPVTIVSDEVHLPYDRPPLSKDVLHADLDDVTLKPAEFYDENDITLRLGSAAASLDTAARTVTLADGSCWGTTSWSSRRAWCPSGSRRSPTWTASGCFAHSTRRWRFARTPPRRGTR